MSNGMLPTSATQAAQPALINATTPMGKARCCRLSIGDQSAATRNTARVNRERNSNPAGRTGRRKSSGLSAAAGWTDAGGRVFLLSSVPTAHHVKRLGTYRYPTNNGSAQQWRISWLPRRANSISSAASVLLCEPATAAHATATRSGSDAADAIAATLVSPRSNDGSCHGRPILESRSWTRSVCSQC